MAELEQAAEDLVKALKALEGETLAAHHALDALADLVEETSERGDADEEALIKQAESLLGQLGDARERLEEGASRASEALQEVAEAAEETRGTAETAAESARDAILELGRSMQAFEEPVERHSEAAATAAEQVASLVHQVKDGIGEAITAASDFAKDEVGSALEEATGAVAKRSDELRAAVQDELGPKLERRRGETDEKLATVEGLVAQTFTDAGERSHQAVSECMDHCAEAYNQAVGELGQLMVALRAALEDLTEEAGESTGSIGSEGRLPLDRALDQTLAALGSAVDGLRDVGELLSRYSFVEM
jgi:chromosome segregation ATPase